MPGRCWNMLRRQLREILNRDGIRDLIDDLEKLVEELVNRYRPLRIILTGSLAGGRFVRGLSDIDLLVVVRNLETNMDRFTIYGIGDVDVEITFVTEEELREAVRSGREFYISALERGITIYSEK